MPPSDPTPLSPPDRSSAKPAPLVLVIDDNRVNAQVLSDFLEAIGFRAHIARGGAEGVELTASLRPACILMDIQMPGMDGLQAMRAIRALGDSPHIPIIAVTALAMTGDRQRCLDAGADEYLSKPLTLAEVRECVQRLLLRYA